MMQSVVFQRIDQRFQDMLLPFQSLKTWRVDIYEQEPDMT